MLKKLALVIVSLLVGGVLFSAGSSAVASIPDPEIVQVYSSTVASSGSLTMVMAECSGGYAVIAGGYNIQNTYGSVTVVESRAYIANNAWLVYFKLADAGSRLVGTYAVCAKLS